MKKLSHPDHLREWKARILEERPAVEKTIVVTSGTCGQASGSLGIIEAFRNELASRGLEKRIGLEITGCHGFCEMEPSIIIHPDGIFYKKLEPEGRSGDHRPDGPEGQERSRPSSTRTRRRGSGIRARRTSPSTATRCAS